jgi:hypothetical protein
MVHLLVSSAPVLKLSANVGEVGEGGCVLGDAAVVWDEPGLVLQTTSRSESETTSNNTSKDVARAIAEWDLFMMIMLTDTSVPTVARRPRRAETDLTPVSRMQSGAQWGPAFRLACACRFSSLQAPNGH